VSALERLVAAVLLAVVLAVAGFLGLHWYGAERYTAGRAAAIAERAAADAKAVLKRVDDNAVVAARQDATNTNITKEKDDEIADLRSRLAAAGRLRVGTAVCPDRPAAPTQADGTASGDGTDPSIGLVSAAADRDLKQLIADVETDLATGRACQSFLRDNGLVP
jgi:prophage endopeptidase